MLSPFKRKRPLLPTVSPDIKQQIEQKFEWFITTFSFTKTKATPFILPKPKAASSGKLTAPDQLQNLLENLCKRWDIDPTSVVLKTFNDLPLTKWFTPYISADGYARPAGTFEQIFEGTKRTFHINIEQSYLKYHDITTAILTQELAHAKLLGEGYILHDATDMATVTDLACIYFGYGISSCQHLLYRSEFSDEIGVPPKSCDQLRNALLCYITDFDPAKVVAHLNGNTRKLFKQDYNYLITTNNTILTKAHIQKSEQQFHDYTKINKAWKEKNFDLLIETAKSLLGKGTADDFLLNYIGYAFIEKKQYHAAIDAFTKAIEKSPDWDHPYNNRGYCRLLLGETDTAYPDLQKAMEINNGNSYTWRHLGIYSILKNDLPKALEYLEQAEKLEPGTWTINYYLGLAHQRSGNTEKASEYFSISKDRAEAIDYIFSEHSQ